MRRWTAAEVERLQVRTVGLNGEVSRHPVHIDMRVERATKYGNKRTTVDNVRFDSQLEARRYAELKLLQAAGSITRLTIQPRFRLDVNGEHLCDYIADFSYFSAGALVVEDAKGVKTAVYRLKKKLMLAIHGIEIIEIAA